MRLVLLLFAINRRGGVHSVLFFSNEYDHRPALAQLLNTHSSERIAGAEKKWERAW